MMWGWVVERTFSWLGRNLRMSKKYDFWYYSVLPLNLFFYLILEFYVLDLKILLILLLIACKNNIECGQVAKW